MNEKPEEAPESSAFDGKADPDRTAEPAFLLLLFPSCCFVACFISAFFLPGLTWKRFWLWPAKTC